MADLTDACKVTAVTRSGKSSMVNLRKRSVSLAGHATSLALEPEFWAVLEDMAAARGLSLAGLILALDAGRGRRPLASACRVSALTWVQAGGAEGGVATDG